MLERTSRRRASERIAAAVFAAVAFIVAILPRPALADADQRAATPVRDEAPARRVLSIEWNPVALLLQRVSINVEIAPAEHHALVLTPYYFYASTSRYSRPDPGQPGTNEVVEAQRFQGFGGEIGYRYYGGRGGMRGPYVGVSVFAMFPTATAGNGAQTSFTDYGAAADIGYQALVATHWLLSVGAGVQYTFVNKSIPDQQEPASVYANRGVLPRLDLSLGYAF
jgi:hypothetical protein